MEVKFHLIEREIQLDRVFQLQLKLARRAGDPDIAGFHGEIEFAGAAEYGGTNRVIRSRIGVGAARDGSYVPAELVVLVIYRSQ